jgi:hypothetical protein
MYITVFSIANYVLYSVYFIIHDIARLKEAYLEHKQDADADDAITR